MIPEAREVLPGTQMTLPGAGKVEVILSAEALAARIVQLLTDGTLRDRMGRAALARARRLFTVDRMVEETAGAYERVTNGL